MDEVKDKDGPSFWVRTDNQRRPPGRRPGRIQRSSEVDVGLVLTPMRWCLRGVSYQAFTLLAVGKAAAKADGEQMSASDRGDDVVCTWATGVGCG